MIPSLPEPARARPLLDLLRDPAAMAGFSRRDWADVVRLGRIANLLGQLAHRIEAAGLRESVPSAAWERLAAHRDHADYVARALLWETRLTGNALRPAATPVVLLKGAAYLALDLPFARGRSSADIDLLVARGAMAAAEAVLRERGWEGEEISAYDQHYYRDWMHEIPPLRHREREIELDLHHTLAPPVGRVKVGGGDLIAAAVSLPSEKLGPGLAVLAEEDRILHAAIHLFAGGELHNALRELLDLDGLFRLASDDALWPRLVARAQRFHAIPPLFWAARYAAAILKTPLPQDFLSDLDRRGPSAAARAAMDALVPRALLPWHPDAPQRGRGVARELLYIRSHWIKMPPAMLAGHLARKALARLHPSGT